MAGGRAAFLTINNGAFFGLAAQTIAGTYNDQLWIFALAFGAILLILAWLAAKGTGRGLLRWSLSHAGTDPHFCRAGL